VTAEFLGVIPELPVPDVDASLAYYRDILGFRIEGRHLGETGEVEFGSVLRGRTNIYISKKNDPIAKSYCWIGVDEVDDLCATLTANGARVVEGPADKPWDYRQFTLEDINGHSLTFFRFSDGVK
jgi:catechol 2,3-dioxygenase-like lactoylglutathione lyase family enzyme